MHGDARRRELIKFCREYLLITDRLPIISCRISPRENSTYIYFIKHARVIIFRILQHIFNTLHFLTKYLKIELITLYSFILQTFNLSAFNFNIISFSLKKISHFLNTYLSSINQSYSQYMYLLTS